MGKIYTLLFLVVLSPAILVADGSKCKEAGYLDFQKDKNQNEETLVKIIQKNPNDMECMLKLIHLYLKNGKIEKGLELLVRANKIDPNFIKSKKIHKILKTAIYLTDLKKNAVENNDVNSWNILGAAYYKMGVFSESIKAYSKSLQLKPDQIGPRLTLALDFSRSDQAYRAVEELSKVISLDKDNFYAYYYTGKILKYQIKDAKKAKIYLQKAKSLCIKHKDSFEKDIYKQYLRDLEYETKE